MKHKTIHKIRIDRKSSYFDSFQILLTSMALLVRYSFHFTFNFAANVSSIIPTDNLYVLQLRNHFSCKRFLRKATAWNDYCKRFTWLKASITWLKASSNFAKWKLNNLYLNCTIARKNARKRNRRFQSFVMQIRRNPASAIQFSSILLHWITSPRRIKQWTQNRFQTKTKQQHFCIILQRSTLTNKQDTKTV